jgi:hypothetical protein
VTPQPSTTRSARGCHPCLGYDLLPMCPGRTRDAVAERVSASTLMHLADFIAFYHLAILAGPTFGPTACGLIVPTNPQNSLCFGTQIPVGHTIPAGNTAPADEADLKLTREAIEATFHARAVRRPASEPPSAPTLTKIKSSSCSRSSSDRSVVRCSVHRRHLGRISRDMTDLAELRKAQSSEAFASSA